MSFVLHFLNQLEDRQSKMSHIEGVQVSSVCETYCIFFLNKQTQANSEWHTSDTFSRYDYSGTEASIN